MDFEPDPEQQALREAVAEMASRLEPDHEVGGLRRLDREKWHALVKTGVVGEPEVGPVEEMVVAEELGRAGLRLPWAEQVLTTHALAATGQEELLGRVATGEALVVPALAEPERSWHSAPLTTAAGGTLSGRKDPVPWAPDATHLVTPTTDGLFLLAAPEVTGSGVTFDATPATELGTGRAALEPALDRGRAALCAEALGAMQAALDMTVAYLTERHQFGVPLMTFQTLTQRAADAYVQVELARSAVRYAAMTLADASVPATERTATVTRTRLVVDEAARLVGDEAIQMHGGIAMTAEYAVGHYSARLAEIRHTWGDARQASAELARDVGTYDAVAVI